MSEVKREINLAELPDLDSEYTISDQQIEGFWQDGFIVLKGVLSSEEIEAYGKVIRDTAMDHFEANDMKLSFGGAFLQKLNLRYDSKGIKKFCLSRRFGKIAARLLEVNGVRIFHDQALFKTPGGTDSHWHQDQYFWPLDTDRSLGLWMPLVDCSEEMGSIKFVAGSHRYGNLGQHRLSEESGEFFEEFIAEERLEIFQTESLKAGDCTFHLGWTIHGAPANRSKKLREAMIVTFYPDGTRVDKLSNPSRVNDAKNFLGGRKPGQLADSELNTVVYS